MVKRHRHVTRPGGAAAQLTYEFMPAYNLTQAELAEHMGVSATTVNQLMQGKRRVTANLALRLARVFGTSVEFWLNAQRSVDIFDAEQREDFSRVKPLVAG